MKPGSFAGEFILAGSRCLIIGQMDLVSHKITSSAFTLFKQVVLDCEEYEVDKFAALVTKSGQDQVGELTIYTIKRQKGELTTKVLCHLSQAGPQIDFKLKRELKSNILLTMLDNQVFAIDTVTGQIATVFEEKRVAIECHKFYDWSIRESSVRLLLLCKFEGLVFVHKVDFDTEVFV